MSDIKRTSVRNAEIAEMLSGGSSLKNFYRFTAQNPHIALHDACQIIINRPTASICFPIEEWNAMGRRVTKGRKGIPYYDNEGYRKFVFDVNDTHGDKRYKRLIYPMKRLLVGLDELNGTELYGEHTSDYRKIMSGVATFLNENEYLHDDEMRNRAFVEGVTYSLYSRTGFPKEGGIKLNGLPYSLIENAELYKEILRATAELTEEIDAAYERKQAEVKVIDDTEENAVSDEPIVSPIEQIEETPVEQTEGQIENSDRTLEIETPKEEKPLVSPFYQKYLDVQEKYPNSVVAYRLGDFYEIMGENAVKVSALLDLTLTGRNVGLPERIPMCGFPYHVTDKYIDKILEKYSVVVAEEGEEPKYILSHEEAQALNAETKQDEYEYDGDEQSESDDDYSDDGEAALNNKDWDDGFEEFDSEWEEEKPQPQEKKGRPIRERKRKEKPQLSLFDLMEGKEENEQTPIEKVTEWGLKHGSGFENGKIRIMDKYLTNPTVKEFADYLKDAYGWGGSYSSDREFASDGKGVSMAWRDKEHPENDVVVKMNWTEVANGIADLIDDGNYFTAKENEQYQEIKRLRAERSNAKSDEEKLKVIARQFIDSATQMTVTGKSEFSAYKYEESAEFIRTHRAEMEQTLLNEKEVKEVIPKQFPYADSIDVQFYLEYCPRLIKEINSHAENAETEEIEAPSGEKNTDLNELEFNQSELGGKKARFKGNMEAIRLVNRLYDQDRTPTPDEKKILAKYVGWGGLAEAFDERNEQWRNEYNELKAGLSFEDYDRAKGSVLNAHYTSKEVISGTYKALQRFGVGSNNRILEPAMGTGNFFGFMPQAIADNARLFGVELDNMTGKIAAKLYPQANVQIKGFEQTSFSNNSFDVVVGNVPFGAYSVFDSEYAKYNFYIHDYFLAKSIDKLKPNGVMAVITSKGTLDKLNPTVRKHLADRAELLGAIRLPNNAFKQTAGTEVVADVLFFRKREEKINATSDNTEWLATGKTEQGYEINNYFVMHPEMVLGNLVEETGLYGALDVTVKPDGRELSSAINEAIERLPEGFYMNPTYQETVNESEIEADYNVKSLCYKADNGRLLMRIGDKMVAQTIPKFPKDAYDRIAGMIELRTQLRHILDLQIDGCSDEKLKDEQRLLNANYDRFVRKYGYVSGQTNARLFREDADSALLLACENQSEDKKSVSKADIFSKRTIRPYFVPTSTDDCFEALQISKTERGRVDISYIEELTKKDYDTVLSELAGSVYRDPHEIDRIEDKYSGFVTAEQYLSGRVCDKLKQARMFAEEFPDAGFDKNVKALEEVQPKPLTASEISARLGASWIDKSYYKRFFCELLGIPRYYADGLDLFYNPHDSSWRVDKTNYVRNYAGMKASEVYGTNRASAFRLFEDCLNLKSTAIYDTVEEDGRERRVLNQSETIQAREKQNKIKEAFKDWLFAEPERREELEARYNALFNQIRLPSYDGSYLKFPEMNPAIELKPHQKNAVHRILTGDKRNGNVLLHHVVGSGKTFTIAATIMKEKQLGYAQKAMIAVPNHLVEQWADQFRQLYPNAKLLIAQKEDLDKDNRQRFVSKVAMGDWDAVIIAQSSFAKIPISPERQIDKIREEISKIERTIEDQWENNNAPRGAIKNLERIKKSREAMLKKLLDDTKKDNVLLFEKLGVDRLYIDEAHYYKNKFLFTKMNNVAGISSSASQRAADLELKVEYINEINGGDKGVVFATGTPISNSMTEMYTMQSYLQKHTLEELGINYFDAWAADFGETITSLEMAPSGQGYKAKTRFAKFTNLPELLTLYRSFADVQTSDMVKLDVPTATRNVINLKPSDKVIELAEEIADRAESINGGGVDPHIDNMLKVTSDGKKLALDARCFDNTIGDEPTSKLNECSSRIYEIWEQSTPVKGTQIVFCDLSTPKTAFEDYEYGKDFDVYNDLKHKLVTMGIPKEEIVFIHDAHTDDQKQELFDGVNAGKIRVLIGSTEKCGAGTNVQKHLVALHHLDTPYRPSDMQQREGRIIRQGNENKEVQLFTYVMERTFDSYSYQILENKQRFISQIDKGDLTVREADDIDETTLTYAEIKAITAANPKIKRKMDVDTEITKLRVLEGQYKKNLYALQDKIRKTYPEEIRRQKLFIERVKEDAERVKANYNPDDFKISVNGVVYTDKKEGARAFTDTIYASRCDVAVAEYGGFKISLNPLILLKAERSVTLAGVGQYTVEIGNSANGNLTRFENFFEDFPNKIARAERKLEQLENDLKTAEEQVVKPFEHAEQLSMLLSEQTELNAELDLNRREEVVIDEEENTEESGTDDGNYMALPEKEEKPETVRTKPRKHLNSGMLKAYNKEQKKAEDALVFVQNGDSYDLIGDRIGEIAERYNQPLKTDNVDGKPVQVLSVQMGVFDTIVREAVESGKEVRIIENMEEIKQNDDFIDSDDKVAQMEVKLLPDYSIHADTMHQMGYSWDGMLPLRKRTAKKLQELGLQVYLLNSDDTERAVQSKEDIEQHSGVFGVEKPDWNAFLETDKAREYLATRFFVVMAAGKVASEDLSYVDATFIDPFIDNNFEEKTALRKYLSEEQMPETDKMMRYTNDLIDEFSERIYGNGILEHYGWTEDNVASRIAENITPEDLKENAKIYVDVRSSTRLEEFVKQGLKEIKWLDGRTENFTEGEIEDIKSDLKEHFEDSEWDESSDEYPYDDWYDDFSEEELPKYLSPMHEIDIDKELEKELDGMTTTEAQEFLGVETIDYKAEVIASVEKEFEDFKAQMLTLSPEDIFYKNFEINVKTELSEVIKEGDYLGDKEYQALFSENGHVLQELYDDFIGTDSASVNSYGETAEFIKDYCWDYYEDIMKDKKEEQMPEEIKAKDVPVYMRDFEYAKEHGEVEAFRASNTENMRCRDDIDSAIKANFDGMHLNKGIAEPLIEKYGAERVLMVLANNIRQRSWDGRFSFDSKEWAKEMKLWESESVKNNCLLNSHPAILDGFVDMARDVAEKIETEEQTLQESKEQTTSKKSYAKVNVAREALIQKYETHSFMRMPESNKEYAGYTYNVFNNRVKDSRQLTDLQSDSRELSYKLLFSEDAIVNLKNRDGDEVELSVKEFSELVDGTTSKDYISDKEWFTLRLPQEAMRGMYESSSLFTMPNGSRFEGQSYYLPNAFLTEDTESEGEIIKVNIPSDLNVTVKDRATDTKTVLSAFEYYKEVKDSTAADYARKETPKAAEESEKTDGWHYVSVSENAKIAEYEGRTLFKMPRGEYEGFVYYIPNGLTRANEEKGTIRLSLPDDFIVAVKNKDGDTGNLSAEAFIEQVKGKDENDYGTYQRPSENSERPNKFAEREQMLRNNVPEEMKDRPNWVIVRTRENADSGRLEKYLIDCHTGKFAESDNPSTWTDFETACKYARENGGETLAYALDGKDKIACIDVDDCCLGKDFTSNVPSEIMQRTTTFTERSISGKGMHFFGKTDGMDLRTFSKDGDLEFYQKAHFIAMTGDLSNGTQPISSFDTPNMKEYLSDKCEKRTAWNGVGKGVEGLSSMSDRDVVEKASGSKHGDTFKALYGGQDLQNNHSNSDMSLMNRLAFWCNGDKEQMLRIFATSGLYREGKSADYYEGTAIKAIKDTTSRFQPQTQAAPKPVNNGNSSGGSGKR